MRKRFFTFIEIMVTLVLTSIILSVIFHFFSNLSSFEKKLAKVKKEVLEKNTVQIRLNTIFSNLKYSKKTFYQKENALFFQFDNKIDPSDLFCGTVNAKLFLDKKNLILKIISLKDKKAVRTEILKKDVKNLKFQFLQKKILEEKFPIIIKIIIDDEKYPFFLSSEISTIIYEK